MYVHMADIAGWLVLGRRRSSARCRVRATALVQAVAKERDILLQQLADAHRRTAQAQQVAAAAAAAA